MADPTVADYAARTTAAALLLGRIANEWHPAIAIAALRTAADAIEYDFRSTATPEELEALDALNEADRKARERTATTLTSRDVGGDHATKGGAA